MREHQVVVSINPQYRHIVKALCIYGKKMDSLQYKAVLEPQSIYQVCSPAQVSSLEGFAAVTL